MADFIKLPRSWLVSRILSEPDFLRAIVYLATMIEDNGAVDFSSGDANRMFGMSPRRYRTFMALIADGEQIDKQTTNKTTNIRFGCQVVTAPKRQAKRQTSDKQTDKQKTQKFIPPSGEDVKAYVLEKGYHFDPAQFVPFYQSKGWMVGKNPMKDWKAACQTWEIAWKKKHGELFYYHINNGPAKPTNNASGRYSSEREANRQRVDVGLRAAMDFIARENGL